MCPMGWFIGVVLQDCWISYASTCCANFSWMLILSAVIRYTLIKEKNDGKRLFYRIIHGLGMRTTSYPCLNFKCTTPPYPNSDYCQSICVMKTRNTLHPSRIIRKEGGVRKICLVQPYRRIRIRYWTRNIGKSDCTLQSRRCRLNWNTEGSFTWRYFGNQLRQRKRDLTLDLGQLKSHWISRSTSKWDGQCRIRRRGWWARRVTTYM